MVYKINYTIKFKRSGDVETFTDYLYLNKEQHKKMKKNRLFRVFKRQLGL